MNLEEYKEILAQAIVNEEDAYRFYQAVADKTEDGFLKELFAGFAQDELEHKELLAGYLAGDTVKELSFETTIDYKITEAVDKPKLSLDMKPADAVALAMKEEEEAMNLYLSLAQASANAEQKALFQSLADMERGHKTKLESLYTEIAFPEVW